MLENLEPITPLRSCKVRTIMESLETKDRETLEKALVDPRWTPYSLSTALEKRGLALADKLIRKHLNAECTCKQLG
jgi:hypothetical protein